MGVAYSFGRVDSNWIHHTEFVLTQISSMQFQRIRVPEDMASCGGENIWSFFSGYTTKQFNDQLPLGSLASSVSLSAAPVPQSWSGLESWQAWIFSGFLLILRWPFFFFFAFKQSYMREISWVSSLYHSPRTKFLLSSCNTCEHMFKVFRASFSEFPEMLPASQTL